MITDMQYESLLRYREGPIAVPPAGLPPVEVELLEMRLIEPAAYKSGTQGFVRSVATPTSYQITEKGLAALEEYEKAQREKKRQKWKQFFRDLTIAVCGSAIGAIAALAIEHLIL